MNNTYAQTNVQLYNQIRAVGLPESELQKVAQAYGLCARLFSCLYRPSGKSFIAHHVGTASILLSLGVSTDIVIAGLLHATYAEGDFGAGDQGVSESKRAKIRAMVGDAAEEYVARYAAFRWFDGNIELTYRTLADLDPMARDVLLIRLANELEDLLDSGILYWTEMSYRCLYRDGRGRMMVEMAEKIGFPRLAGALEDQLQQSAASELPMELRSATGRTSSFLSPPKSSILRPSVALGRMIVAGTRWAKSFKIAHPKICYWEFYGIARRRLRFTKSISRHP
jgi:(p)ppGpp synthase/HD superfamily hydrolase